MKPILLDFPMPIITPRLILRAPQLGDGGILNDAVISSFENIHFTMPWVKEKPSIDESEEFVRQAAANWILKKDEEPYLPLFIFDKNNHLIGSSGFHHIQWGVPCLEIGYWIRNQCAGHGFMTEAVNAITQYAFKVLNMKRVAITCDVDNERSKRIPERLGFHLEGTLKANRIAPTGSISDTLVFARYNLDKLPILDITYSGE